MVEASRWWIWSIAVASPVIVVLFAFWSLNQYGYHEETLAEWVFMGVMLFVWAASAVAGLVLAIALILSRWRSRGAEAVLGLLLSGTSVLMLAGAMLLAYFG